MEEKAKHILFCVCMCSFSQKKTVRDDRNKMFKQIIENIFSELKEDLSLQNERTRFRYWVIRKDRDLKNYSNTIHRFLRIKRKFNKLSDKSKTKQVTMKEKETERYQTSHLQHLDLDRGG